MNKIITSKMGNTSMPDIKFTIQNKQQQFSIYYLDNQDLYWSTYTDEEETTFLIERTDYELYRSFHNLFSNLRTNKLLKSLEYSLESAFYEQYLTKIEELKTQLYNSKTNTITFVSNDLIDPSKPDCFSLDIKECDLAYEVIFHKPKESRHFCSIRFNTNRSEYGPLVTLFTTFYKDLLTYEENYQYSISDYIETKQAKQYKKKL